MKYGSITDGWVSFSSTVLDFHPSLLLLSHVACFSGWQEGGGEEPATCVPIITLTTALVHLTRSPVLCLLSVFILLHPASTHVSGSSAWAAFSCRGKLQALCSQHRTLSLFPLERFALPIVCCEENRGWSNFLSPSPNPANQQLFLLAQQYERDLS